jgi:MtN3 and saliva related transmembrane protein
MIHDALAVITLVFTIAIWAPQAWRSWRLRDSTGLALESMAGVAAGAVAWLVYGILIADAPIIGSNIAVTIFLALAIWPFRDEVRLPRVWVFAAVVGLLVATVVAIGTTAEVISVVATIIGLVCVPATARGAIRSEDPFGVSIPTWLVALTANAAWVAYGVTSSLWTVVGFNIILTITDAAVLARVTATRRRHRLRAAAASSVG